MSKLKPIVQQVIQELQKPENDPTNNKENIYGQFAKLTAVIGKIGENLIRTKTADEKQFKVFFNGIRNLVCRLSALSIGLLYYLDTEFDADGKPIEKNIDK